MAVTAVATGIASPWFETLVTRQHDVRAPRHFGQDQRNRWCSHRLARAQKTLKQDGDAADREHCLVAA